jgi:uncharacterized integral membrane protein
VDSSFDTNEILAVADKETADIAKMSDNRKLPHVVVVLGRFPVGILLQMM